MSYQVIAEAPDQPMRWTVVVGEGEALTKAAEWRALYPPVAGAEVRILGARDVVLHAWDGSVEGWTVRPVPPRERMPAWKNTLWRLGVGLRWAVIAPTDASQRHDAPPATPRTV